jgi:CelD/BcsL family acetyltransferase involved in cellulose biosynthesis
MIAQLHHAAATQRGLVSDAQVGDRTAVVERLATHPAARAYLLVGSTGDLLAGTFGLVRDETFYGLVSGGLTEGVAGKKSANRLVKLAALDAMRAEGIRAYDFGIGETAEKQQLCDTREAIVDLIVPFTLIGHGLAPLLGAHVAMRASAKRNGLGEVLRRWRRARNTAPNAWPRLPAAIWRGNGKPRSAGHETSC